MNNLAQDCTRTPGKRSVSTTTRQIRIVEAGAIRIPTFLGTMTMIWPWHGPQGNAYTRQWFMTMLQRWTIPSKPWFLVPEKSFLMLVDCRPSSCNLMHQNNVQEPFFGSFRMKTNNAMSCSITGNNAVLAIPSRSQDVVHEPSRLQGILRQKNALMKVVCWELQFVVVSTTLPSASSKREPTWVQWPKAKHLW